MSLKWLPEFEAQTKAKLLNKHLREKHQLEHTSGVPKTVHPHRLHYINTGMFSKTVEHLPPAGD